MDVLGSPSVAAPEAGAGQRDRQRPRVVLLAIGTRGDVQPLVALGVGLRQAGCAVRVATHVSHEALVRDRGLDFAPVTPDFRDSLTEQLRGPKGEREVAVWETIRGLRTTTERQMSERLRGCWEASRDADLVVASVLSVSAGYQVAQELRVPLVRVFFQPTMPTGEYAVLGLRGHRMPRFAAPANRWSHRLAHQALWLALRSPVNAARREVLDQPPLSLRNPLRLLDQRQEPVLHAYSALFYPRPADWQPWVHVTGFWFLAPPPGWCPPSDLMRFLAAGPPPVYVGFGSMPSRAPEQTTALVLAALRRLGQRAVLSPGWGGLTGLEPSEELYVASDVPHDWLFPRVAAVVHHGGLGTTAQGLRAGVPTVTVPMFPDQRLHGRRIAALGLGPPPLARRELTAERLAAAIAEATGDVAMRRRAVEVSRCIQREDGVGRAVEIVQRSVVSRSHARG